jgi:hypothetical protein
MLLAISACSTGKRRWSPFAATPSAENSRACLRKTAAELNVGIRNQRDWWGRHNDAERWL